MIKKFDKRIYLSSPTMHTEEQEYIKEAFATNWVAPLGKNVDEFENAMINYVGVANALALSSGTAALHLAIKLAGIKQGDIVLCSDLTFAASANPISYEKAEQVFIDSDYTTWNLDINELKKAIMKYNGLTDKKPKALVAVHLYGSSANILEIQNICKENNIILIEDAAESLGATFENRQTGSFGDFSVFSYNGNKLITTSGGGMLMSNNKEAIDKARFWSTQARDVAPWYQHSEIGYNYRMSNVVAGIGCGQMKHVDEHIEKKKHIYYMYKEAFKDLPITMNGFYQNSSPNYWLSCMLIDKKCNINPLSVYEKLNEYNVESRPIWKPMHMQPVFSKKDFITSNYVSEDIFARGLCLPSDIKMTEQDQNIIIEIIKNFFK